MAPPRLLKTATDYAAYMLRGMADVGARDPLDEAWLNLARALDIIVAATIESKDLASACALSAAMADFAAARPELLFQTKGIPAAFSNCLRRKCCPVCTTLSKDSVLGCLPCLPC
jgi:hypothetical protein